MVQEKRLPAILHVKSHWHSAVQIAANTLCLTAEWWKAYPYCTAAVCLTVCPQLPALSPVRQVPEIYRPKEATKASVHADGTSRWNKQPFIYFSKTRSLHTAALHFIAGSSKVPHCQISQLSTFASSSAVWGCCYLGAVAFRDLPVWNC